MKHLRVNEQNKYHHFQESPQATTVLVLTTWPHKNHNNIHFWKTADYMTEQNTHKNVTFSLINSKATTHL